MFEKSTDASGPRTSGERIILQRRGRNSDHGGERKVVAQTGGPRGRLARHAAKQHRGWPPSPSIGNGLSAGKYGAWRAIAVRRFWTCNNWPERGQKRAGDVQLKVG